MTTPTWRDDPRADLEDDERNVFIPAIMGAGLLFSIVTVLRDMLHSRQGRAPGLDRGLDIAGRASARHVLTGQQPAATVGAALRPRAFYLLTALACAAGSVYVVIGATANYFRPGGYVSGIAWLWVLSLALGGGLILVGVLSWRILLAWPDPPPAAIRLLVGTPLGRSSAADVEAELPRLLLGWAVTAAAFATGVLALMVIDSPRVDWADARVTALVNDWDWLSSVPLDVVGKPEVAAVLAILVGVSTLRCRVFALAYIGATAGGWSTYLVLKTVVDQPRPSGSYKAGLVDSFASGHLVQATIIAGLVPVALTVLTRRRWPARLVAVPMALAVVFTGLYRVHAETHWMTDVIGGILVGATFILVAYWVLHHPRWHARCDGCPWAAGRASPRRHGLFGLHPTVQTSLRWGARAWTFVVIVLFGALSLTVGIPRNPEGDGMLASIEQPLQLGLLAVAAMGWLLAWRLESVGAVFLAAMTAALLTVGWAGASAAYDHFYGPAHPESSTALLPVDRVAWVWSGAVTDTSFRVTARIDDEAASQAALLVTGAGETRSAGPEDMPESGVP